MAFDRKKGEVQLELDEIQGDIIVGLQKDFEAFLNFRITKAAPFKRFLKDIVPDITTARKAKEREFLIAAQKAAGQHTRLSIIGLNVGFTFEGLKALGVPNLSSIIDVSFRNGLAAASAGLGDPTAGEGSPAQWKVGGDAALHGILIVTGPNEAQVAAKVAALKVKAGTAWVISFEGDGKTRDLDRGHEHFGFLDGVSQPAVRGQIDRAFPGHTFLDPSRNPNNPGQGLPGADLHWPGEFLFGYPTQKVDDIDAPGPIADGGLPWMKNGSFMVFRRLKQFVPEFESFVATTAAAKGMDPQLLGARMVGRWKSGSPVSLSPLQDNPAQGADELQNNDFEFGDDGAARRCPYSAHIRKSYPRNDITPAGSGLPTEFEQRDASEADTQTHRIMRRGIPFGEEVDDTEAEQSKTLNDRGLMFVCYQTSLTRQFEFILKAWVNNPNFAKPSIGFDPILGAAGGAARDFVGASVNYPTGPDGPPTILMADFIIPTGGGYFLMPSIKAIRTVLS